MKEMMTRMFQKSKRYFAAITIVFMYVMASSIPVFASDSAPDFSNAASPVVTLIDSLVGPIISIVGALGAVYCVILRVKLAKADEPQEREKAKMALKNAIVGFFLIFILIVVMRLMLPTLNKWVTDTAPKTSTEVVTPGSSDDDKKK